MKVDGSHLTYCTNIHPGETWPEVFDNVRRHVPRVRDNVAPDRPFGVGLRLSARAARSLCDVAHREEFRDFLRSEGLYVFTLNGFPYGPFHGQSVKAQVYLPDWSQSERVDYTKDLIQVLAALLPEGMTGSISTVPGGFKPRFSDSGTVPQVVSHLVQIAAELFDASAKQGKEIVLALEPEPCCLLETTEETVRFFEGVLFAEPAREKLAQLIGVTHAEAERILRRHLGVCLDTCHAAVQFEDPDETTRRLAAAGLRIAKVQLSAGLRLAPLSQEVLRSLLQYDESVYLHQVVARKSDGKLLRFEDLPPAFANREAREAAEWRVHFHVPLYTERLDGFSNTQPFLARILRIHQAQPLTDQLEVETYTWDVLPEQHRRDDVATSIARELDWVLQRLRR